MSNEDENEELLPLDSTCPNCHYECDIGEIFDGGSHVCEHCGALLQAASYGPSPTRPRGSMSMFVQRMPPTRHRGRAVTRRRWARQGRR